MAEIRWDDNLNDKAKEIAQTDASPFRIIAGPGTGKTYILIRKIARLLQEGKNPKKILVCTFTRTAANDLKNELECLGISGSKEVVATTIHSLCFSLLSNKEVLSITGRVPRPLMKFEERFLLQDLKCGENGGIEDCKLQLKAFSAAWARLQSEEPGWPLNDEDKKFQNSLLSWLSYNKAISIGELIPIAYRYIKNNPISVQNYLFEHVLIDEYQDLNRAEQLLLEALAVNGKLTIIGDENQSIYSFKHAHPEGISEFKKQHKETVDGELLECRRCPKTIVSIANSLISNNENRKNTELSSLPKSIDGEIKICQWSSMEEETKGITEYIRLNIEKGSFKAGRILILSPRREFGYAIRDSLNSVGIKAHSFFNEEDLECNPKLKDKCDSTRAFSLLTLLSNKMDRVSLRCWCGYGHSSLNDKSWTKLVEYCKDNNIEPIVCLEKAKKIEIKEKWMEKLLPYYNDLEEKLSKINEMKGQNLLNALFPKGSEWANNFRLYANVLGATDYDAKKLLEILRTSIIQPELPTSVDFVRVMSLHKSKGLTADLVIVVGCMEGLIPYIDKKRSETEKKLLLEEQRRLFYVAITRTKKTLVLSSISELPKKMGCHMRIPGNPRGNIFYTQMSSFIDELGKDKPDVCRGENMLI